MLLSQSSAAEAHFVYIATVVSHIHPRITLMLMKQLTIVQPYPCRGLYLSMWEQLSLSINDRVWWNMKELNRSTSGTLLLLLLVVRFAAASTLLRRTAALLSSTEELRLNAQIEWNEHFF